MQVPGLLCRFRKHDESASYAAMMTDGGEYPCVFA